MIDRNEIQIRDPFVYADRKTARYYLYGTTDRNPWNSRGTRFNAYRSADLKQWEGPFTVFAPPEGFWGTHDFWAPEVVSYRDSYYMFASFKAKDRRRGTQILRSDSLLGPFLPIGSGPVTPSQWECLDGTLHVDEDGTPWLVFCHEWVQADDGEIWAMRLTENLTEAAGEPILLFKASEAPWTKALERRDGSGIRDARVTDGPFLHRQEDGQLVMLWSSLGEHGYVMGCARSASGLVTGPWVQPERPLVKEDGGHGMVFETFSGQMMLTYHTPNKTPYERFVYRPVSESPEGLVFGGKGGTNGKDQ